VSLLASASHLEVTLAASSTAPSGGMECPSQRPSLRNCHRADSGSREAAGRVLDEGEAVCAG